MGKQAKPAYFIDAPATKLHFNRGYAYFIDTKVHFNRGHAYFIDTKVHFNRGHAYFIDAPTTKTHFSKARAHDEAHATDNRQQAARARMRSFRKGEHWEALVEYINRLRG